MNEQEKEFHSLTRMEQLRIAEQHIKHLQEQLDAKPKPATGEWTVFGTSVQANGEALFHCSTRKDAEIASLEHNAARAAERKRYVKIESQLKAHSSALEAEREKVQTLVDALKIVDRWLPRNPMRTDDTRMCEVVRGTLAKVK